MMTINGLIGLLFIYVMWHNSWTMNYHILRYDLCIEIINLLIDYCVYFGNVFDKFLWRKNSNLCNTRYIFEFALFNRCQNFNFSTPGIFKVFSKTLKSVAFELIAAFVTHFWLSLVLGSQLGVHYKQTDGRQTFGQTVIRYYLWGSHVKVTISQQWDYCTTLAIAFYCLRSPKVQSVRCCLPRRQMTNKYLICK